MTDIKDKVVTLEGLKAVADEISTVPTFDFGAFSKNADSYFNDVSYNSYNADADWDALAAFMKNNVNKLCLGVFGTSVYRAEFVPTQKGDSEYTIYTEVSNGHLYKRSLTIRYDANKNEFTTRSMIRNQLVEEPDIRNFLTITQLGIYVQDKVMPYTMFILPTDENLMEDSGVANAVQLATTIQRKGLMGYFQKAKRILEQNGDLYIICPTGLFILDKDNSVFADDVTEMHIAVINMTMWG